MFDVSPKTIRDVWNRRTWQRATCHLWEEEGVNVQAHPQAGQQRTPKVRKNVFALENDDKICD
jgi:hypothetical protein